MSEQNAASVPAKSAPVSSTSTGRSSTGRSSTGRSGTVRREYGIVLLVGAVGAGLILLAVRQEWARAVFTEPKPLPQQVVSVSGSDLVPLAGALALVALAGLAAVIATRGMLRRAAGALLALFGAGAGAAVLSSVSAASVVSDAASKIASPGNEALSGAAGSTTSGTASGGSLVVSGSVGHAIMTGTPWHVAVLIGALLIFVAGVATVMRGTDWPVMSARYDAPRARSSGRQAGAEAASGQAETPARAGRALDSATMWESLSGGADPTEDEQVGAGAPDAGAASERKPNA